MDTPHAPGARHGTTTRRRRPRPAHLAWLVTGATLFGIAVLPGGQAGAATTGASASASATSATLGTGEPTDPNLLFEGRWDTSDPDAYVPGWAGASVTVGFTGTTVALDQRGTVSFWYSIDGSDFTWVSNVKGEVDLTTTPLADGEHTLEVSYRIVAGSYTGDAVYQGVVLDDGASTVPVEYPDQLVEFVGDSITAGYTSTGMALTAYPWLVGEELGVQHTQVALSGACLREVSAEESTRGIRCYGLEDRFPNWNFTDSATPWDFSAYTADVVVINLGTNDIGHGVTDAQFEESYVGLVQEIRAVYPDAVILAMQTFRGRYIDATQAAVAAVNAAGDADVHYVDTLDWGLTSEYLNDSVHPNDAGHELIASHLAPVVAGYLED